MSSLMRSAFSASLSSRPAQDGTDCAENEFRIQEWKGEKIQEYEMRIILFLFLGGEKFKS